MSRNKTIRYALLIAALAFPRLSIAQGSECPKMASADEAISALDHADIKSEFCARTAFRLIEQLPKDEAIPILIRYLGYPEPLTNAPRSLESPYPAEDSLANIGVAAESPLIEFIAQSPDEKGVEYTHAIHVLGRIRHGDVVPTIKHLRQRSAALAGTPAGARLQRVAEYMLKTYCPAGTRRLCEKRLREPTETR